MARANEYYTYQREYMRFHTQHSDIHKAFMMGQNWRNDGNDEHYIRDELRTGFPAYDHDFIWWARNSAKTLGTLNALHDAWQAGWECADETYSNPCVKCGTPIWHDEYLCSQCVPPWCEQE